MTFIDSTHPGLKHNPSTDIIDGEEEWEVNHISDSRLWPKYLQHLVYFKGFHTDAAEIYI